jgi:DNA-binding MarR family transcriptional regulator
LVKPPPPVELADRIHSAAVRLLRRLRRQDEASGLTAARLSALSVVVFGGPITIGQLAAAEQVSAPTMTRLVLGMEHDGLVRRERDAADARVTWLHATPKGTRLLQEGRARRVSELAREMDTLSAADRAALARAADVLERLAAAAREAPNALPARAARVAAPARAP